MAITLSKTPETGFLRDFHFSTLADVVLSEVFGELSQPEWMRFAVTHNLDVFSRQFVFTIEILIEPYFRWVLNGSQSRQVRFNDHKKFGFGFRFSNTFIEQFRGDIPKLFVKWMSQTLLTNAHYLYEFDPRIGFIWGGRQDLSVCPLFDPPEDFSRTGFPTEELGGSPLQPSCAFCGQAHSMREKPVWGGANLMWLHWGCWRVPS